jgi:hypothetical protein
MKNNNVVIGLLVVVIVILALIAFKKPANAPVDTPDENTGETELDGTKLYRGEGFSFRHDKLASVRVEGAGTYAPLYTISRSDDGGAADHLSFFPAGMPSLSEYNPCGEMEVKSMTIGDKLFSYCDSKAEPMRTYIYKDGEKALMINVNMTGDKPATGYIDLASIDLK